MVKKLLRFLAYTLFFILALVYFAPKISVYYFLEEQIKPMGVVISSEELSDSGFSLNIENASVSFKSIESANVENTNIKIFGIYNSIGIKDIVLSSAASSFVPLKIASVDVAHSIFNPLNVNAEIVGEFGEAKLMLNILDRRVHIKLLPSKLMLKSYKNTLRSLKKDKNGEYIYDKTF